MTLIQKLAASAGIAALLATGACASMPSAAVEASPAAPTIQTEGVAPGAPGAATTWGNSSADCSPRPPIARARWSSAFPTGRPTHFLHFF